jgi:hypothetical protein
METELSGKLESILGIPGFRWVLVDINHDGFPDILTTCFLKKVLKPSDDANA